MSLKDKGTCSAYEPGTFDDPNWTNPGSSPSERAFFERRRQQHFLTKGLKAPPLPPIEPQLPQALPMPEPKPEHKKGARLRGRKRGTPVFGEAPRLKLSKDKRCRIMHRAEAFERRTKKKGKKNGLLGASGVTVLRSLIFTFLSAKGQTYPSYSALQEATGLCRQTVCECVERLERHGFLKVINRIKRVKDTVVSPLHGGVVEMTRVVQTSNAYTMHDPEVLDESEATDAPDRPFPPRRLQHLGSGMPGWQQGADLLSLLGLHTKSSC